MKRCPSCNRTYTNDAQKFCTKDGTSLVAASAGLTQGETVRLDSAELGTTQFDPEVTKIIPRDSQPTGDFDPYKTMLARPDTTSDIAATTGDLMPASMPPQPAPPLPASSGPITPPPASAPLPPPPDSGPINAPSQPLQSSSSDVGQLTLASFAPPPPVPASGQLQTAPPVAAAPTPAPVTAPAVKKKSKLPLVLGILVVLMVLGIGVAGVAYWFVIRPMLENREVKTESTEPSRQPTPVAAETPGESAPPKTENVKVVPPYVAPSNAVQFVNSKGNLDGKLAEHYVDFSFYYPKDWQKDPKAGVPGAVNFAKVERRLPPDFTQENFAVGWYSSAGSEEGDRAAFPGLAANLSSQFAKSFSEYRKVKEGAVKVGAYDGYEFRFESISRNTERGDVKIWGRVIFLPPVDGGKSGVTLLMLATSLAPELKSVNDVGVKGDLPMMLDSFRFGK